jgi:hypothetical protein
MREVTAKTKKSERVVTVSYNFHEDSLASMSKAFGEDVVKSSAVADMVIALQSTLRSCIEKNKTDAEITALVAAWKPGVKTSLGPADPVESTLNKFAKMSPEDQAAFMKSMQERLKALKKSA